MMSLNAALDRRLLIVLLVTFLVGVIVGLVVLGWWLLPVQYLPARPADLEDTWRRMYLSMAADSYAQHGDAELARKQLEGLLGADGSASPVVGDLQAMAQERSNAQDAAGADRLLALAAVAAAAPPPGAAPGPVPAERAQGPMMSGLLKVCGTVILVLVVLAGFLLVVYFLQARTAGQSTASVESRVAATGVEPRPVPTAPRVAPPPVVPVPAAVGATMVTAPDSAAASLGPFVATYNLGDIDFDMSFGIESPAGDFLGECGLGMAETIGGGEVQRVTAFEVWLFDKTDIRTVSLVLASAHAHGDAALRAKLSSRGEVVAAQPGSTFSVKTSSLQLDGRILDLAYGGGDVPAQSYFTSFSVELVPTLLNPAVGD